MGKLFPNHKGVYRFLLNADKIKIGKCLSLLKKSNCDIISDVIEGDRRIVTYSTLHAEYLKPAKKKFKLAKPNKDKVIYEVDDISVVGEVYSVETDKTTGKFITLMVHKEERTCNRNSPIYYISYKGKVIGKGHTRKGAFMDACT